MISYFMSVAGSSEWRTSHCVFLMQRHGYAGFYSGSFPCAMPHTKDLAMNLVKSMLGKVSDATLKKVANTVYDTIINGDFSQ